MERRVALGCIGEAYISFQRGALQEREVVKIRSAFEMHGLPVRIPNQIEVESVTTLIDHDKKRCGSQVAWSLLRGSIGAGSVGELVSSLEITNALKYLSD